MRITWVEYLKYLSSLDLFSYFGGLIPSKKYYIYFVVTVLKYVTQFL